MSEAFTLQWLHTETTEHDPLSSLRLEAPGIQGLFLGSTQDGQLVSYFSSAKTAFTTEEGARRWLVDEAAPVLRRAAEFLARVPGAEPIRAGELGSWDANGAEVA